MKQLYTFIVTIIVTFFSYAQDINLTVSVPDGTTAVKLTGPFWSWDANNGPTATHNGNDTWTVTMSAPTENMQYKWIVDGTYEDLIAAASGGGCTDRAADADVEGPHMITNYSNYANRIWKVGDGDIVNDVAGSCGTFLNTSNGFDNVASTIGWTPEGDAASDTNASLEFDSANGNTGGALKLTGNNTTTDGKAYIFSYTDADFNYLNSTNVKVQFDAKFANAYNGAIHLQTQMPGSGTVNTFDIQNNGINENTWTAIEYDFANVQPTGTNDIFKLHFNLAAAAFDGAGGSLLIDNLVITLSGAAAPPAEPTDAPDAPTEDEAGVLSIYSDAYTDLTGVTFNPNWGQSTVVTDVEIAGNNVKKYSNFNYSGIELPTTVNLDNYGSIKIDYWTELTDKIEVYLVDLNGTGDTVEQKIDHNVTTKEAWQTIQINLSEYNTLPNVDVRQIKLVGTNIVYFDNIYFSSAVLGLNELKDTSFSVYPNPVQNTLNVSAAVAIDAVSIFDLTGREVLRAKPNAAVFSLDVADLNKGLYLVTVKAGKQELTTKLVK